MAVVDDEEHVRRALRRLLQSTNMAVATYASGAEFIASLAQQQPDCVILDLHMPGINGFEVQSHLTRNALAVPVVVITGHDTPESRDRALAGGAAAYLRKPVDEQVLLDAIDRAMAGAEPAE